jgi:hypothetical protein
MNRQAASPADFLALESRMVKILERAHAEHGVWSKYRNRAPRLATWALADASTLESDPLAAASARNPGTGYGLRSDENSLGSAAQSAWR